jgi:hypothetical protein
VVIAHHDKGSSTRLRPFAMIYHWHRSILLYHRKNIAPNYPAPVNMLVYGAMMLSYLLTVGINGLRRLRPHKTGGRPAATSALPATSVASEPTTDAADLQHEVYAGR